MRHVIWSCSTFLPSIIKYSKGSLTYRADTISMDKHSCTRHVVWSCITLSNITKGDNAKRKKGRNVILVRDTSSGPVLHFYQVPSKYSNQQNIRKDIQVRERTRSFTPTPRLTPTGSVPKTICTTLLPFGRGSS